MVRPVNYDHDVSADLGSEFRAATTKAKSETTSEVTQEAPTTRLDRYETTRRVRPRCVWGRGGVRRQRDEGE